MPITPFEIGHEEIDEIFADRSHVLRGKSGWLARAYFPVPAATQEYLARPGLILAESTVSGFEGYFVPYSSTVAYGGGSDTAVGVLGQLVDLTDTDEGVAPVIHAKLIEAKCYVLGGALGTVPAGVKTALSNIHWV